MDLGTERLIGRKDGEIGWMIFNNPERRNAISLYTAGHPRRPGRSGGRTRRSGWWC